MPDQGYLARTLASLTVSRSDQPGSSPRQVDNVSPSLQSWPYPQVGSGADLSMQPGSRESAAVYDSLVGAFVDAPSAGGAVYQVPEGMLFDFRGDRDRDDCDEEYDDDSATCRAKKGRVKRALCWAAIAVKYGACIEAANLAQKAREAQKKIQEVGEGIGDTILEGLDTAAEKIKENVGDLPGERKDETGTGPLVLGTTVIAGALFLIVALPGGGVTLIPAAKAAIAK